MTTFDEVEIFKKKKLLKILKEANGNGTSMISLVIPPKDQISRIQRLLIDEQGTASNIKSKVNRLSVLQAISSASYQLKSITKIPENGLGLFVGEMMTSDGKVKKVSYAIEPVKPINTSLYMCDNKFHVEDLLKLFEDDTKYGFVIADGHGATFATLQGNTPTVLQQITEHLPKKHGRGGQSSVRFARLRIEKREAYVKKINEIITSLFVTKSRPNVAGIIIAGNTYLKNDIRKNFDARLDLIKIVDINYGGINGLYQTIELCDDLLKDIKFSKETKILKLFLHQVNVDSGKYSFGYASTMHALSCGAVETLIVFENLNIVHEGEDFVDWIAENYKDYGCSLAIVSDRSAEGTQFVEGFGGIGSILRYSMENDLANEEEEELDVLSSFESEEIF